MGAKYRYLKAFDSEKSKGFYQKSQMHREFHPLILLIKAGCIFFSSC